MAEEQDEVMFGNVVYDNYSNRIHLWEIVNGVKEHKTFDYEHNYYVSDANGDMEDMYGNKMGQRTVKRKKEVDTKYMPHNTVVAESDINEAIKFLHERYNFTDLMPDINNINTMTYDIEVAVEDEFPKPEEVKYAVNAIASYFTKSNRLVVFTYDESHTYNKKITVDEIYEDTKGFRDKKGNRIYDGVKIDSYDVYEFTNERKMLEAWINLVRKEKVDIITGWNIEKFDNPYIINRLKALGSNAWQKLSPLNKVKEDKFGGYQIIGMTILDYMKIYKDKFTFDNKGSYALNNICRIELKKGKLEYEGTLSQLWKEDWDTFITYNIIDTLRVVELDRKLKLMELIVIMTHESLIPFESILGTIQDHLGLTMRYLAKQGKVLNNRDNNKRETFPGAFTLAVPGKHRYVISFDVTSLYPTIIIRDNIGQESLIQDPETDSFVEIIKDGRRLLIAAHVEVNVVRDGLEQTIVADNLLESDIIVI